MFMMMNKMIMKVALMMKWDLKHPTVSDLEMVAEL